MGCSVVARPVCCLSFSRARALRASESLHLPRTGAPGRNEAFSHLIDISAHRGPVGSLSYSSGRHSGQTDFRPSNILVARIDCPCLEQRAGKQSLQFLNGVSHVKRDFCCSRLTDRNGLCGEQAGGMKKKKKERGKKVCRVNQRRGLDCCAFGLGKSRGNGSPRSTE